MEHGHNGWGYALGVACCEKKEESSFDL